LSQGVVLRLIQIYSPTSSRDKVFAPPETTRRLSIASHQHDPRRPAKPLSTEGSIIPGETEEDGLLRREYVFIADTRAVEFNRAVDGEENVRIMMSGKLAQCITTDRN
jgi:hypothetical protein